MESIQIYRTSYKIQFVENLRQSLKPFELVNTHRKTYKSKETTLEIMDKRFKCTFHSFRGGLQCRVRGGVNPSPGNLGKRDWRIAGQTVPLKPPVALKGWWD